MIIAFNKGGDFHSRTALSMYPYIQQSVAKGDVILDESERNLNEKIQNAKLLKEAFPIERHRAKIMNFSIAYGKTAIGLSNDLNISLADAKKTIDLWYNQRNEVKLWQFKQMLTAIETGYTFTMLGRRRNLFQTRKLFIPQMQFPFLNNVETETNSNNDYSFDFKNFFGGSEMHAKFVNFIKTQTNYDENRSNCNSMNIDTNMGKYWRRFQKENVGIVGANGCQLITYSELNRLMRRAINTPVQGSAADFAMKAMLNIWDNKKLKQMNYKLLLQIHDEVILEGPIEHVDEAKRIVKKCMECAWPEISPTIVKFEVDINSAQSWLEAK